MTRNIKNFFQGNQKGNKLNPKTLILRLRAENIYLLNLLEEILREARSDISDSDFRVRAQEILDGFSPAQEESEEDF